MKRGARVPGTGAAVGGGRSRRPGEDRHGTVEGDIHDIGKNIVSLLLGNHGFDVVDLEKDVARTGSWTRSGGSARSRGLSALMTTTMVRMGEVVRKGEGGRNRLSLPRGGGGVVTPSYAESIGARYARDGVEGRPRGRGDPSTGGESRSGNRNGSVHLRRLDVLDDFLGDDLHRSSTFPLVLLEKGDPESRHVGEEGT